MLLGPSPRRKCLAVLGLLTVVAGCRDVTADGFPASAGGSCPAGFTVAGQRCYRFAPDGPTTMPSVVPGSDGGRDLATVAPPTAADAFTPGPSVPGASVPDAAAPGAAAPDASTVTAPDGPGAVPTPPADAVPPPPPPAQNGASCTGEEACKSGFCVDDVCCDRRCQTCESCVESDRRGVCTAITGSNDTDSCGQATNICLGAARCGQIDQSQPQGDPIAANGILWEGRDVSHRMSQTFSVQRGGRLAGVLVQMKCPDGAEAVAEIQTTVGAPWGGVQPSGQVLASQRVTEQSLHGGGLLRLIRFDQPPTVSSGSRLSLVFKSARIGLPTDGAALCWIYVIPRNPYRDGEALDLVLTSSSPNNWQRWIAEDNTPADMAFETVVLP